VACGGGDDEASGGGQSYNPDADARYTPAQVAKLAGFKPDPPAWVGPNGEQIAVIVTTRGEIELYASAGDPVVTNPAGDVGVKFFPEPGARAALLEALRKVK